MKTFPAAPPKHPGLRIEGEEFPAGHFNAPGQSQLSYRVGVYFTFLERMLTRLKTQKISDPDGSGKKPLASLNITDPGDIVVAILQAWAVVGDVLTFYQERIANEGYWRTATEGLSTLALVRTIGYQPNSGLAATTHLAFTLAAAPGAPATVVVPRGTAVMSTPVGGQQPQTFETSESVNARVAWNSVPAYVETTVAQPQLFAHSTELRLGSNIRLKPADPLLLVGDLQVSGNKRPGLTGNWLRVVKSVAPDKAGPYTLVTLEPAAVDHTASPLANPHVFAFRQRASLFGFNAPQWNDLAVNIKQKFGTVIGGPFLSTDRGESWRSNNSGLPPAEIHALVIGGDGSCFAGMAGGGVCRLAPDGARWELKSPGPTRSDVYSLAVNELGHIFVGTSGGSVFRSTDNGDTWVAIGRAIIALRAKEGLQAVDSRLPATVVRSLVTGTEAKSGATLLAGTDNGVFRAHPDLSGWSPCNRGLPNTDAGTGLTSTVINSLVISAGGEQWYAGTDHGVYLWSRPKLGIREDWVALNQNLPVDSFGHAVTVFKLIAYTVNEGQSSATKPTGSLMAGTDRGVYVYREDSGEWRPANNGLPTLAETRTGVVTVPVSVLASGTDSHGTTSFFAGTSQGLYRSQDQGTSWMLVDAALFQMLFALSNPSPELSHDLNQAEISTELRFQFQLQSFSLSADAYVVSVIEADRSWQIYDGGLKRTFALRIEGSNLNVYLINTNVCAVAADLSGKVIAATPPGGIAETEWPDFAVQGARIDLETIRKGILPDSYVALSQHTTAADSSSPPDSPPDLPDERYGPPEVVVCKVCDSFITPISGYTRSGTVTTIETDATDALIGFDRRLTDVFVQSEELALFEAQVQQPTLVQGNEIVLAGLHQNFEPGRKLVVSGKRVGMLIVADLGGVVRLSGSNCNSLGPAQTHVSALVVDSQNNLVAGTQGAGLLQYVDAFEPPEWVTIQTGTTSMNVTALAVDALSRNTYAAFAGGELVRASHTSGSWTPLKLPVTNEVRALTFGPDGRGFAGTDGAGIFRVAADGSWEPAQTGLFNLHITSLAIGADGKIFAGSAGGGVFRSLDAGDHWQAINRGLANLSISALVIGGANEIYAATRGGGIFSLADESDHWKAVNDGLFNRDVRALAVHLPTGNLFAGTSGNGVFRLTAPRRRWQTLESGVSNDVRALVVAPNGDLYAGTRNAALLTPSDRGPLRELKNEPVGFALPAKFQADFDLGVIPSEVQKIFASNNEALTKDANLTMQQPGRIWLIASGKSDLFLIKNEPSGLSVYKPNYLLEVAAGPTAAGDNGSLRWQLLDSSGESGSITARIDEISPGPALLQGQAIGELVVTRATKAEPGQKRTIVTVNDPALENIYDAATVKVYANVAAATHGETVYPSEILGSGNASYPNQSFVLKKPPLTYVPATQPGLAQSTLAISVSTKIQEGTPRFEPGSLTPPSTVGSSVEWVEAPTLSGAGENRRVYMVRTNEKGQTFVIFGDGVDGARLPSGRENIVAGYRSGIGAGGNLDAGQLTLLKTKSASVRSVTNPTPASGGIDPESLETALSVAPLTVRALGRVVSLLDYEDFVRTMPGIGKARVKALYRAEQPLAHLTIAAEDGSPIAKDTDYYANLVNTISRYSSSAHKFQVDSYEPLFFKVSAQVTYDKAQDHARLQAAIEALMAQTFSFAKRDFGQAVEASEIVTLIQNIPGVVSVSLSALYLAGSSETLHSRLRAAPARFDPVTQMILPAQLLLLDSNEPLQLTWETTP